MRPVGATLPDAFPNRILNIPPPLPPPLQREYRARGLLPGEALSRFEALGVQWDCTDGTPAEREWMAWFGRLLYVIERHNSLTPTVRGSVVASLPGRPPTSTRPSRSPPGQGGRRPFPQRSGP